MLRTFFLAHAHERFLIETVFVLVLLGVGFCVVLDCKLGRHCIFRLQFLTRQLFEQAKNEALEDSLNISIQIRSSWSDGLINMLNVEC